jgi:cytochrome oxidase Cu insertion factor (SCO1/SenC/PrrC family)
MKLQIFLLMGMILIVGGSWAQGVKTEKLKPNENLGPNKLLVSDTFAHAETVLLRKIQVADKELSTDKLVGIINNCHDKYANSKAIAQALTKWLGEDHPIYEGKSATEVDRFRGYLLSSLSKFPPNEELYGYVKAELSFAGHVYNAAAAAVTARNFPEKSDELIVLMQPYLQPYYLDEWVDLSTPDPIYPFVHPTKARYEIIETLKVFGESAYSTVKLLDQLSSPENFAVNARDSILFVKSVATAKYLRELTPSCCQKDFDSQENNKSIQLIEKKNRKNIAAKNLSLQDQDANKVDFSDLKGKPFVLAFFYTQCSNPLKCASTVNRLADLQAMLGNTNQGNKIGIYGMTYDPDFDDPSILRKYGEMYGISFAKNVKFLRAVDNSDEEFTDQLHLRVNYGAGTVNQHGIQLFLFDKKGKIAALVENENWSVDMVKKSMEKLIRE